MDERRTTELEDFLRSCRSERRLAPLTCSAYERDVSACLGYLQGECIEDLAEEQKRRPAMSSQARTTAALKSFFRFLVDEERLVRDPALPLRTPGKQEALPDVLTMGELSDCSPSPAATSSGSATFHGKAGRDRLLLA
jgi:integrase/recombinase XerD